MGNEKERRFADMYVLAVGVCESKPWSMDMMMSAVTRDFLEDIDKKDRWDEYNLKIPKDIKDSYKKYKAIPTIEWKTKSRLLF